MYSDSSSPEVRHLAAKLYADKRSYLLKIARRHADSEADAEEALQETFANFLHDFDPAGEAPALAWVTLALKRRCWRQRYAAHLDRYVGEPADSYTDIEAGQPGLEERVAEVDSSRGRLAQLKSDERSALILQGAGFGYREIGARRGWSYTKVNRCMTEGRSALRRSQ